MFLKKCQILLLVLLSFGGAMTATAQDTLRLSLNDALRMAQEKKPEYQEFAARS